MLCLHFFFFFNDTATTEIYTLSLHDALPISSTPPQLLPPSDEKYARIGTRKISFDPAVSMLGLLGLRVTYVSLCGPHSFDTSTFGPTSAEAVRPPPLIGPFWARDRYLFHQLGMCELS